MGASVSLGKILGIPVRLHFSWLIIFLLATVLFARYLGESWSSEGRWLAALGTSFLLFVSVLFHELAHSLVAVRRGIPVAGITLFIFGGISQMEREPDRASTEFLVAVVGPFSSVILGLLFLALAFGLHGVSQPLSAIAGILFSVNIGLVILNMLPGFPLDGGRVLRAVVWGITRSYSRATVVAIFGGRAIAALIMGTGIVLAILDSAGVLHGALVQGVWLVILGVFLQMMASASHRQFRRKEKLYSYTARNLMASDCPVAPGLISLRQIMEEYIGPAGCDSLVLTDGGRVQGLITRRLIEKVPRSQWDQVSGSSLVVPLEMSSAESSHGRNFRDRAVGVGPEEPADAVIELMESKDLNQVLVLEEGVLLGTIGRGRLRGFA